VLDGSAIFVWSFFPLIIASCVPIGSAKGSVRHHKEQQKCCARGYLATVPAEVILMSNKNGLAACCIECNDVRTMGRLKPLPTSGTTQCHLRWKRRKAARSKLLQLVYLAAIPYRLRSPKTVFLSVFMSSKLEITRLPVHSALLKQRTGGLTLANTRCCKFLLFFLPVEPLMWTNVLMVQRFFLLAKVVLVKVVLEQKGVRSLLALVQQIQNDEWIVTTWRPSYYRIETVVVKCRC
jgi:hypothetical protein